MNKMLEELIVKEYINIVKELKDMNESNMEGIINLAKDNMNSIDVSSKRRKQRICNGIAKFYIKIAHIYASFNKYPSGTSTL